MCFVRIIISTTVASWHLLPLTHSQNFVILVSEVPGDTVANVSHSRQFSGLFNARRLRSNVSLQNVCKAAKVNVPARIVALRARGKTKSSHFRAGDKISKLFQARCTSAISVHMQSTHPLGPVGSFTEACLALIRAHRGRNSRKAAAV